ncbi:MAG: endolytic transglycosylase MltG [Clostridiales bacterium]|nr:endolytic transglycosylase MltG [Clostridiales bacterium]
MEKAKKKLIIIYAVVLAIVIAALVMVIKFSLNFIRERVQPEQTVPVRTTVSVTFPEGFTVYDIAKRLEENHVCNASDFILAVNDGENLGVFEQDIANAEDRAFKLEGYLFPDTYEFYRNSMPQAVVEKFLKNTQSKITDDLRRQAEEQGMTMDEVLTLASIIQREASHAENMGKVSSVFRNRLKSASFPKLQSDSTTFYINNSVKPCFDDTEKYSKLYDTYKCKGLPAGAICNPGMDAIKAALEPEKTNYYYFVSDNDNNYYYAETYAQHKKNCASAGLQG